MFKKIVYLGIIFFANTSIGQELLHHQMIGAQGGSYSTSNQVLVEQSIGQAVVHGFNANQAVALQEFQQNIWYKLEGPNINDIAIKLYPNPFVETINFSFSKSLNYLLKIKLFDLLGRIIIEKTITVKTQECHLSFSVLPAVEYMLV